jgi:hypothetical protein
MGVLFATFRRHVVSSELRAIRSFVGRCPAGIAIANLFWHGGTSANRRSLSQPISLCLLSGRRRQRRRHGNRNGWFVSLRSVAGPGSIVRVASIVRRGRIENQRANLFSLIEETGEDIGFDALGRTNCRATASVATS